MNTAYVTEQKIVQANSTNERYFMFDIVRIICALFIFGRHAQTMAGFSFGMTLNNLFIEMTGIIMTAFFALSGFSLYISNGGGSLFKEEKLSRFYKKRAISILPLYYFVHFAWILLNRQDFIKGLLLAPVELLGLQSVFTSVFGVLHNGGTWFISCIIISYFLFPLVHEIIQRSSFRTRFILLCLCIFIIRYMPYYATISGSMSLYTNPFYRTIEFIMGMLLASLKFNNNREGKEENKKKNIYYTIIVIISSFILLSGFHFHYKFIEDNSVILACIIIFCSSKIRCWRLSNSKCLIYASQLTYGFYILQLFVWTPSLKIIEFLNIGDNKFDFLVALFLLCFVCVIIHELYEKPLQRYLRKKI